MKHKLTALLLSLVLCVSLIGTVFATGATSDAAAKGKRVFIRVNGVTVEDILVPEDGKLTWEDIEAYSEDGTTVKGYIVASGTQTPVTITKDSIAPPLTHTHTYSSAWSSDASGHWHAATCGHNVTSDFAAHVSNGGVVTTPATSATDGVKTFSCSVCGYVIGTERIPATGGGSSGGGSTGGSTGGGGHRGTPNGSGTMSVNIGSMSHGKVTASPSQTVAGALVTLTVRPNAGYTLDRLTVTDAKGNEITLNKETERRYTFTMPDSRVTVDAAFTGGSGVEAPTLPASGFYDVPDGYWAAKEIAWASSNGIMNGVGGNMFNPGSQVNRQQTWMVLGRMAGAAPADMAAAREWAMANGVSDGSKPTNPLSRQQLVALLYRYAQLKGFAVEGAADLSAYPDRGAVAKYAQDPMAWAVGNGIITGTSDGRLNPEGTATRAQFAVIMYRFSLKTAG